MSLNDTPAAGRLHIGFFGRRNAGKSSLVNAITGQDLAVVSDVQGTTTDPVSKAMELLPLGPVQIIDTPGFSSFDSEQMELILKENLQYAFPDFAPYLGRCRYHDCAHLSEPGCAVLEALAAGELEPTRHASYARLYEAAKEIRLWEHKQP